MVSQDFGSRLVEWLDMIHVGVWFLEDDVLVVGTNSVFASDVDGIFEDKGMLFGIHLDKSSEYMFSLGFGVFLFFSCVLLSLTSLFFLFNFYFVHSYGFPSCFLFY